MKEIKLLIYELFRDFTSSKQEIFLFIFSLIFLIIAVIPVGSATLQSIAINIVAAYIFYVFIELIPRVKNRNQATKVLNYCIASVVEGFVTGNPYQHEKSIVHVRLDLKLETSKIFEYIEMLDNYKVNFLQLKATVETADSRLSDFQHLLILAASTSPTHALRWLTLTDKIRLLSEQIIRINKNINPNGISDIGAEIKRKSNKAVTEKSEIEIMYLDFIFRTKELFEEIIKWNKLL